MGRKNKHASPHATSHNRTSRQRFEEVDFEDLRYEKNPELRIKPIKYKNEAQKIAHETIQDNVLTFVNGEAGTAKTFVACYAALESLAKHEVKKIILTRPNIDAAKSLGHLPGSAEEKMLPFLMPLYDCIEQSAGTETLKKLIEEKVIEVVPIGFLRGRTFHDSFILIDEAQNLDREQLRLALTRIGTNSKCVVTYDQSQIDIRKDMSCHIDIPNMKGYNGIGHHSFTINDVVRSEICGTVLQAYQDMRLREENCEKENKCKN